VKRRERKEVIKSFVSFKKAKIIGHSLCKSLAMEQKFPFKKIELTKSKFITKFRAKRNHDLGHKNPREAKQNYGNTVS